MFSIPDKFAQTQRDLHGADGERWLAHLPALLDDLAERWSLTLEPPFEMLSYNYAAPATRAADGTPVVLKVGFPWPETLSEIAALRAYDGRGICRLLDADEDRGAMLLERLLPGTMLVPMTEAGDDDRATRIAAGVMRDLWRPAPADVSAFPDFAEWTGGLAALRPFYEGGTGPFPTALVDRAERLHAELLASAPEPVLLHGDLHHYNVLAATRAPYLAIDPKGLIGEPAYEPSNYLRNPMDWVLAQPDPARVLARRLDIFTDELGLPRERILAWGIMQTVLSAWWNVEGHGHGYEPDLRIAELLVGLQP